MLLTGNGLYSASKVAGEQLVRTYAREIAERRITDRRATWVELTSEGTRLALQTHAEVTSRLHRLINHLPLEDRKHLTAVVEHLLAKEAQ